MDGHFIRVTQRQHSHWSVMRGPRGICLLTFKMKSQAIAYARVVSLASHLTLYIDDEDGTPVRQNAGPSADPAILASFG